MQEVVEELDWIFKKISVRINKSPSDLEPFKQILKDNWLETADCLKDVTDQQFLKLKIPIRVVNALKQQIALGLKTTSKVQEMNVNNEKIIKRQQILTESCLQSISYSLFQLLIIELNNNKQQFLKILKRICVILSNILKDPYELKFRTLRKSNELICKTFWGHPSCMNFITKLGFQNQKEVLYLHVVDHGVLFYIQQFIRNFINLTQKKPRENPQNLTIQKPINKQISSVNHPGITFNKQSLQNANYAQVLQQLNQYRHNLMAIGPKNRRISIYHKRYEKKQEIKSKDLETTINQNQDKIITQYWKDIIQANKMSSQFQSKRKKEFQQILKQKIYLETCIKIKLPNQFIIQFYFGPLETLQTVMNILSSIIIGDLYLYISPPVKKLTKQMNMTLEALQSVPNGSFYVGFNGEWAIDTQYAKKMQI